MNPCQRNSSDRKLWPLRLRGSQDLSPTPLPIASTGISSSEQGDNLTRLHMEFRIKANGQMIVS